MAGIINVSGEVSTGTGRNLTKEGKLRDTAVLNLNVTETIETFLVGTIEQSEGIEEAKRGLSAELGFEGVEGSSGLAGLGRGESGGGGGEGGKDGSLHRVGQSLQQYQ